MKTHHPLPAALLTLLLLLAASWSWAATAPKPESPPLAEAESYRDPLTGMEFIKIQGGSFQMGSPEAETDHHSDEKLHWVSVGSFWLGKHEVTVSQFRRFVNATGYRTDAKRNDDSSEGCFSEKTKDNFGYMAGRSWEDPGFRQGDDHPVICVSWNDAVAYAEWLSKETGKTLPSAHRGRMGIRRTGWDRDGAFLGPGLSLCKRGGPDGPAAME